MIQTLNNDQLTVYLLKQLKIFFPDDTEITNLSSIVNTSMLKILYCFNHISLSYYNKNHKPFFNHLNADHYTLFVYYCSFEAFKSHNIELASKLFYLNKILHSFHCMYDTVLPDIFLVIHGTGVVLGKASYNDYFVVTQGCTVGADNGETPTLQKGVIMYPNSSIIGNCTVDEYSTLSIGTTILNVNITKNQIVFMDAGKLQTKNSNKIQLSKFFKGFD